jgi:hypothetical protein
MNNEISISQLQQDFLAQLLSGEAPSELDEHSERFSIYRNNFLVGVKAYLSDTFKTVQKLVGEKFFNALSQAYIEHEFPTSGNLHEYGASFSTFIAEFKAAESLPYLAQVANLDWAHHQAYYAIEPKSLDVNELLAQGEAALLSAKVCLKPSVQLLASDYPVDQIWAQSQDDYKGEFNVDLKSGACQLLVFRNEWKVQIWRVNDSAWCLLQQLYFQNEGTNTLENALTEAMQHAEPEMVQSFLGELFTQQLLTQII